MCLDLENAESIHPADKLAQHSLARSTVANKKAMSHRLTQYPIDSKNVFQDFIKDNKWHIKFFFIENSQSGTQELFELGTINTTSFLAQPRAVEDWSGKSRIVIYTSKPLASNFINLSITPLAFRLLYQTIRKESQCFVSPNSNKFFLCQTLIQLDGCFVNTADPTTQFTRRVKVLWLHLWFERSLALHVKLNHGFSQCFRFSLKIWEQLHHSCVERSVDL
mmetsp:Transcript_20121/g.30610  ORF Transcript_20121/g.30610 Transcript_20121/m.30610 type:complete len:221 (-) Transcript_20121:619-1281(-)